MRMKEILLSWDIFASLFVFIFAFIFLPCEINGIFAKDIYGIAISVLSTVFPMFFAALAIITSFSDNEFISFLENINETYTALISHFKYAIITMFFSLLVALALFSATSYYLNTTHLYMQSKFYMVFFFFILSYSLLVTLFASLDAIKYLQYRTKFIREIKQNSNK
jgi:Na+/H+-translocating membrane pyrophosphatase